MLYFNSISTLLIVMHNMTKISYYVTALPARTESSLEIEIGIS